MEPWQWTSLILCGFGLFKEFRPSEPFLTEYLTDYKGIPQDLLVHTAFPVWTYTYLGTLAIVFLITDFLRYRVVIILEGFAYVATWIILTWGKDLTSVIFVEILYGIACSTEVAYYTYIYAKVDRSHYKKVTSFTYSAILLGRFLGGITGQLFVSFKIMDYHQLNYISLTCVSIATIFAICLPSVDKSIYFYRTTEIEAPIVSPENLPADFPVPDRNLGFMDRIKKTYPIMWNDFKKAYSGDGYVLKWSIWWAVATAVHLQVLNFIQPLWEIIKNEDDPDAEIYNGAVEATHTLLSAILAFGVGYVKIPWFKYGEIFLSLISILQGAGLILMSQTKTLNVSYACYVLFRILYQVMITVASAEVAQGISEDSYGLIFGVNTFIALALQTILTLIVADDIGLALGERSQFFVYGGYSAALGILFLLVAIYSFIKYGCGCPSREN